MELPVKKRRRLADFDYSGEYYYFVTICTANKKHLFGDLDSNTHARRIAESILLSVPEHRKGVNIDKYVIMPNHIHAIITIGCDPERYGNIKFPSLPVVVGSYKAAVSREIHKTMPDIEVWQESFHEHVIRNEHDYKNIWTYIDQNPSRWSEDKYYK